MFDQYEALWFDKLYGAIVQWGSQDASHQIYHKMSFMESIL